MHIETYINQRKSEKKRGKKIAKHTHIYIYITRVKLKQIELEYEYKSICFFLNTTARKHIIFIYIYTQTLAKTRTALNNSTKKGDDPVEIMIVVESPRG